MPEKKSEVLEALDQAAVENEALAEVLARHRAIAEAQLKSRAQMTTEVTTVDEPTSRERLASGTPQVTFEQLGVEEMVLSDLVSDIVRILAADSPELAGTEGVGEIPSPEDLMEMAKQVFEGDVFLDESESAQAGLVALAVDLALVPYLKRAAEAVMPHLDQELWLRGHCPVCGAIPDFSLIDEDGGARHLICSRCGTQWRFLRLKCPFCANIDAKKLKYYLGDDEVYRLYVCELCKHYVKTVDLRKAKKRVIVPVERIVTVAMDLAAQEGGYTPA